MTHLAFELRTNTPDALTADLAERVEASGYRSLSPFASAPRNSRRAR